MPTIISGDTGVNQITDGTIQTADFAAGVGPVFTKEYVSAEQTITFGGSLTLSHGLGVAPKLAAVDAVCKTAQYGYSIGDVLVISPAADSSGSVNGTGLAIVKTASDLVLRIGNAAAFTTLDNTTGAQTAAITPANWRLIVRAWA